MTDSTLKSMLQVHRVWSACVMDIARNPEAGHLFTQANIAKLTDNNHTFQESAEALCDLLQTDLIHFHELVHRDIVKTVLSAMLYKATSTKAE